VTVSTPCECCAFCFDSSRSASSRSTREKTEPGPHFTGGFGVGPGTSLLTRRGPDPAMATLPLRKQGLHSRADHDFRPCGLRRWACLGANLGDFRRAAPRIVVHA
jgi:hypothetical protein